MSLRKLMRPVASAALAAMVALGAPMAAPAVAESADTATSQDNVRTVTFDASQAAEFQGAVDEAVRIWNDSVQNVQLEPANGGDADVTILADDGWPRAMPDGLGAGTIWMGRQAVDEGHKPPRIAAHEMGHIFGMPDRRTGICEELMSGASAGTDCANATPNRAEIDEVENNFANGLHVERRLYVDVASAS